MSVVPSSVVHMISGTKACSDQSVAGGVLAGIREQQQVAGAAQAAQLAGVLAWCELHVTDDPDLGATWGDVPVQLGGDGCPWVREFTITELAAALRMSLPSARSLVADVLELAFRLPRLWAKVQTGAVQAWRARRIAEATQSLSVEAASFVDAQVAGFADRMGLAAVERLVGDAVGRFMPELAREQRAQAADGRRFDIDHEQVSFAGTSRIEGELDLADALDLEAAISGVAHQLHELGNDLPLDQRRALAAGELARAQLGLDLRADEAPGVAAAKGNTEPSRPAREVVIYAHLSEDAVRGNSVPDGAAMVSLEGHGDHLVTLETLRGWLNVTGDVKVSIRPVIDLNADLTSVGRFASGLLREQLVLRDRTCVAPHCQRPARRLDLDHIDPWDDNGPPGQTSSANLAALCRHHHRAKTLTSWDYQQLTPGVFLWDSPHGLGYLTFAGQTIDLD